MRRETSSVAAVAWFASAFGPAIAADDEPLDIREWPVPYEDSRPRDPFATRTGAVWFVGQQIGYLAKLDVESGEFTKVDLKDGSGPHNLVVGSDGIVWYAGNRHALVGRYDPARKAIEEIAMPDPEARDPHTLVFDAAEENIWFTVQGGNRMGRLNIASRKVDLLTAKSAGSRPNGIKVAPDGSVWVALFGTHRLARIDAQTFTHEEFELPRDGARPRRL